MAAGYSVKRYRFKKKLENYQEWKIGLINFANWVQIIDKKQKYYCPTLVKSVRILQDLEIVTT